MWIDVGFLRLPHHKFSNPDIEFPKVVLSEQNYFNINQMNID